MAEILSHSFLIFHGFAVHTSRVATEVTETAFSACHPEEALGGYVYINEAFKEVVKVK